MADVAAQRHGELLAWHAPPSPAARYGARHPQVGAAVRHARHLWHGAAGLGKGLVHIPQRAGAADLAEVKVCGRLPLADVARAVHADEEERHAARAGPLQGGQAVAHRLETHAKLVAEPVDVVVRRLGRPQEGCVGQHQRPRKVVGQTDARQRPGLVAGQPGAVGQALQLRALLQKRQLRRHLKRALPALQPRRQLQQPGLGLEHALRLARQVGHIHHAHPVGHEQALGQRLIGPAGQQAPVGGTSLGRVVQLGNVVLARKEEVAYFFIGHGWVRGQHALAAAVVAQGRQPLQGLPVPLVERQQRARDGRHTCGQLADLGQRDGIARALPAHTRRQVSQHLSKAGDQTRLVVVRKPLHIHTEHGVDLEQNGHRERALVLLQLVEVAGRQVQRPGQRHLGHAALFAQAAQAHTHEGFFHSIFLSGASQHLHHHSQYLQIDGFAFAIIRQFSPYRGVPLCVNCEA
ncbi:hypothetical protein D3C71_1050900 [compost metagenome]